jgi:hypothetical protein
LTLASTLLTKWTKELSGKQDKQRTYALSKECIKEWFRKFEVVESRRKQLKYVRHLSSIRMSKDFDGISEFAEAVRMLFKLSNMVPNGDSYPTPNLTDAECRRAIFEAQWLTAQEMYSEGNNPSPKQSKYNDMINWFKSHEVYHQKRQTLSVRCQ